MKRSRKCIIRKRAISFIGTAFIVISAFPSFVSAAEGNANTQAADISVTDSYSEYTKAENETDYPPESIVLGSESLADNTGIATEENGTIEWRNDNGVLSFKLNVSYAGSYSFQIDCMPDCSYVDDIWFGLMVDGKYPFSEAEELHIRRFWTNSPEFPTDKYGNEYSPEQEQVEEFFVQSPYYTNQTDISPIRIALSEGEHTLTFVAGGGAFFLRKIILEAPRMTDSYSMLKSEYENVGINEYNGKDIVIQGEKAILKNSRSLIPKFDNSAGMEPASPYISRLNYIGSTNWKTPGESISWNVAVPESGLYKLVFRYRQSDLENGVSYRRLAVDGDAPFTEAESIGFPYSLGWEYKEFSNSSEPYLLYLTQGEHTITLTVTMGEMEDYYEILSQLVTELGDIYIQIGMITGETPDANRDYDLFARIPELGKSFNSLKDSLDSLAEQLNGISGRRGSQYIAAINNMSRILVSMLDNPFTAQNYKSDYYTAYSSLCSWLSEMRSLPLDIDEIYLISPDSQSAYAEPSFLTKLKFGIQRLLYSFSNDYGTVGEAGGSGESLRIWVNWGRDQASILQAMIQESFTPKTGISVRLDLVNASLVNGILSGNAPDCAMQMARTEPVNLAMRGALYDLTKFEDYTEVAGQFKETATVPYEYGGGVYALPDTQNFNVLFYRSDILESLDIEVPETWEEFLKAAAVLQRNNMRAYIPYTRITSSTSVNTGIGGLNMFPTFMLQRGLSLYNDELNASTLSDNETIAVFSYWTDFYTKYKFPVEANFYNQFRVGTAPLGVYSYSLYTTLKVAAPELAGRWGIALMPGTSDSVGGHLNRSAAGSGTGSAVLSTSKNKEAAWKFVKWWVSAETQLGYSNSLEAVLGEVGRHPTANLEAFSAMPWSSKDKKILTKQWNNVIEIPEVPGGYYLSRAVDQAFLEVVNGDKNSGIKDVLVKWGKVADNEITRKISEYVTKGS